MPATKQVLLPIADQVLAEFIGSTTVDSFANKVKCPGCESKFGGVKSLCQHLLKHPGVRSDALVTLKEMRKLDRKRLSAAAAQKEPVCLEAAFTKETSLLKPFGDAGTKVFCIVCQDLVPKPQIVKHFTKGRNHKANPVDAKNFLSAIDGNKIKNGRRGKQEYTTFERKCIEKQVGNHEACEQVGNQEARDGLENRMVSLMERLVEAQLAPPKQQIVIVHDKRLGEEVQKQQIEIVHATQIGDYRRTPWVANQRGLRRRRGSIADRWGLWVVNPCTSALCVF